MADEQIRKIRVGTVVGEGRSVEPRGMQAGGLGNRPVNDPTRTDHPMGVHVRGAEDHRRRLRPADPIVTRSPPRTSARCVATREAGPADDDPRSLGRIGRERGRW